MECSENAADLGNCAENDVRVKQEPGEETILGIDNNDDVPTNVVCLMEITDEKPIIAEIVQDNTIIDVNQRSTEAFSSDKRQDFVFVACANNVALNDVNVENENIQNTNGNGTNVSKPRARQSANKWQPCPYCGKKYARLSTHAKACEYKFVYSCIFCPEVLLRRGYIKRHLSMKHPRQLNGTSVDLIAQEMMAKRTELNFDTAEEKQLLILQLMNSKNNAHMRAIMNAPIAVDSQPEFIIPDLNNPHQVSADTGEAQTPMPSSPAVIILPNFQVPITIENQSSSLSRALHFSTESANEPLEPLIDANAIRSQKLNVSSIIIHEEAKDPIEIDTQSTSVIAEKPKANVHGCIYCNECDYKSCSKVSLRAHITTYHSVELNVVPYKCSNCEQHFPDQSRFADHKANCNITTLYACPFCKKVLVLKESMSKHFWQEHVVEVARKKSDEIEHLIETGKKIVNVPTLCTRVQSSNGTVAQESPTTPAQRQKNYRERTKQKFSEADSNGAKQISEEMSKNKRNAQYQKDYRERQKVAARMGKLQENRLKKTKEQYQKEYRDRLKLAKLSQEIKSTKNQAQRSKEYRERLKLAKSARQLAQDIKSKKTAAQRAEENRNRRKLEASAAKSARENRVKKTAAQYQKEYRERRKLAASKGELGQAIKSRTVSAERLRKYRERLRNAARAEKLQESHLFPTDAISSANNQEGNHVICDECSYKTNNKALLVKHITNRHSDPSNSKLHKCFKCGKSCQSQEHLNAHKTICSIKFYYPCLFCTRTLWRKNNTFQHILQKHSMKIGDKKPDEIKDLLEANKKTVNTSSLDYKAVITKPKPQQKLKFILCDHCSFRTLKKHLLVHHILKIHSAELNLEVGCHKRFVKCSKCDTNVKDINLLVHSYNCSEKFNYTCTFCQKVSVSVDSMKWHIRHLHSSELSNKSMAEITQEIFSNRTKLKNAVIDPDQVDASTLEYIIVYCSKCKSLKTIRNEIRNLKNNCRDCGARIIHLCSKCKEMHALEPSVVKRHWTQCNEYNQVSETYLDKLVVYTCSDCQYICTHKYKFDMHLARSKHMVAKNTGAKNVEDKNKQGTDELESYDEERFTVRPCVIDFAAMTHRYCPKCDKIVTDEMQERKPIAEGVCQVCNTRFVPQCAKCSLKRDKWFTMRYHLSTKCFPGDYLCIKCKMRTPNWQLMQKHYLLNHTNRCVPYLCEFCSFKSTHKKNFYTHLKKMHPEKTEHIDDNNYVTNKRQDIDYICDKCSFTSKHKWSVKMHLQTIHGPKKHKCKLCKFKTRYIVSLNRHVTTKHKNSY